MAGDRRAVFHNPAFYCGFNSLTHCLYNIVDIRNLILSFDPHSPSNRPVIIDLPGASATLPGKVGAAVTHFRTSMSFAESYISVFRQIGDHTKTLDLTESVTFFEDPSGHKLLMDGPTDPLIEFIAILSIFSLADRVILCPTLMPPINRFVRLCCFLSSTNFQGPVWNSFLQPSHRSSIFMIELDGYFYDFQADGNPPNAIVLHELPKVLCVHFEDLQEYPEKKVLLSVDFTRYVFDRSRGYVYQVNSFIMMHNRVHATAYIRIMKYAGTGKEKWLICNDGKQTEVGMDGLHEDLANCSPGKRAIVGFYERVSD
jgi:hypothetical protein